MVQGNVFFYFEGFLEQLNNNPAIFEPVNHLSFEDYKRRL